MAQDVIPQFVMAALQGQPMTVYGDGSQTRSFCFVEDLLDGLMALMDSSSDFCGPVNLGMPKETTILDLARLVTKMTGSNSTVEHRELPADDPSIRCPDITLARERLGWSPSVELEEGLVSTIEDLKKLLL